MINIDDLQNLNKIILFAYTYIIGPIQFAYFAKKKGKNPWITYFTCLILTPYIGGVILFYTSFFDNMKKKNEKKKME